MKDKDMTTQTSASRRLTPYLAGPALALGLAIGSAAVANAEPISEGTIKSECKAAGGTYTTYPSKKKGVMRISSCTYKDINGDTYHDDYYGGEYAGTSQGGPA